MKVVSETDNTFKTSVKQVREQSMKKLKAMKADKLLPEDDFKVNEKAIETQIQNCNSLIDDLLKKKENTNYFIIDVILDFLLFIV